MVKSNVIFKFCVKFAIIFAGISFFIVILGAIFNHVEIGVILERIITAELIFAPMGFLIGFVLSNVLKNILFSADGKISIQTDKPFSKQEKSNEERDTVVETSNGEESGKEEVGKNIDVHDTTEDIPMETPMRDYTSTSTTKSNNGKYIMVNDKKIVNDPKVLAEAVKTMINEG